MPPCTRQRRLIFKMSNMYCDMREKCTTRTQTAYLKIKLYCHLLTRTALNLTARVMSLVEKTYRFCQKHKSLPPQNMDL